MSNHNFQEAFRPQFHFTPPTQWLNDPNGMVYYEGEYHLFYQHHPDSTVWGPMHWGHAVSRDLVTWEHLPIGLAPDEHGMIFSGSAVVDWQDSSGFFGGGHGLVAIFTHADVYPSGERARQRQSLAYSLDKGRTWTKYEGNPVLADENVDDFRDPKVFWHGATQAWIMVLAVGNHIRFYTSTNLKDWVYASDFGLEEGSHAGVWECPDLIELPVDGNEAHKKWLLIVSIGDHEDYAEGSRTQYFIGEFDGLRFRNDHSPETILWLDYGRDNYAGVTWSDVPESDGRYILMGWMTNWKYATVTPTSEWRGAMTLPRVLSLHAESEGIRVRQQPVEELTKLRGQEQVWQAMELSSEAPQTPLLQGDLLEIEVEFEPGSGVEFGIQLEGSQGEYIRVGYNCQRQELYMDRSHSGRVDFHPQFASEPIVAPLPFSDGRIQLRIFVDWSSIEVFANGGCVVMTNQIFHETPSLAIIPYVLEGTVNVVSLTAYALQSIYTKSSQEQLNALR